MFVSHQIKKCIHGSVFYFFGSLNDTVHLLVHCVPELYVRSKVDKRTIFSVIIFVLYLYTIFDLLTCSTVPTVAQSYKYSTYSVFEEQGPLAGAPCSILDLPGLTKPLSLLVARARERAYRMFCMCDSFFQY
jgi:hypothetical protein